MGSFFSIVRATNSNVNYKNFRHISTSRTLSLFFLFFSRSFYSLFISFALIQARQAWAIMNERATKSHIHICINGLFLLKMNKTIPNISHIIPVVKLFNNSLSIQTQWRPEIFFSFLLFSLVFFTHLPFLTFSVLLCLKYVWRMMWFVCGHDNLKRRVFWCVILFSDKD